MGNIISMPIASAVSATHVSLARTATAWVVTAWSRETGTRSVSKPVPYSDAVQRAKAFSERTGAILNLPEETRHIDVLRYDDGGLAVMQFSAGDGSATILETFGPHEREQAVRYALHMLPHYPGSKLGRVD